MKIPQEFDPGKFLRAYNKANTVTLQKFLLEATHIIGSSKKETSLSQLKHMELIEKTNLGKKPIKVVGTSCCIFSKTNWIRNICY